MDGRFVLFAAQYLIGLLFLSVYGRTSSQHPPSLPLPPFLPIKNQATNFGHDYEDKMAEYRREKAKEEARLEADRARRREELYGLGRKKEGGGEGGEVEVEDLGAVEDREEKEREIRERRERVAAELAVKMEARRVEKERKKKEKQEERLAARRAAKAAARAAKGGGGKGKVGKGKGKKRRDASSLSSSSDGGSYDSDTEEGGGREEGRGGG